MLNLVFVHGWGLSKSFWSPLKSELNSEALYDVELGYFDRMQTELPKGNFVFVTHSFGGIWALENRTEQCRGMCFINGFTKFCAGENWPHGVKRRVLDRMIRKFPKAPEQVWTDFMQLCGDDDPPSFAKPLIKNLENDLIGLGQKDARRLYEALDVPMIALAAKGDPVVPFSLSQASFGSDLIALEGHDHLSPKTHPQDVARHLNEFLSLIS